MDSHHRAGLWQHTVFWRLAALLIGVQVFIGIVAIGVSAFFAYEESLDLVENSLRLRLDGLAEEIERRVPDLDNLAEVLPAPLVNDLATRFPDPLVLVDVDGRPLRTIRPDPAVFGGTAPGGRAPAPPTLANDLASGDIVIRLQSNSAAEPYAVAPLYDAAGFQVGGVMITPLERSLDRELQDTIRALRRAVVVVVILGGVLALLVGGLLTWRIVRPIRMMTSGVERIGRGEYRERLAAGRDDEFGRLSAAINSMAGQVEESFNNLKAADRLRRDLVANIGHDLRTPLGGILGHIEEAGRLLEAGENEPSRTALESARRQVDFVTRLVEDLFELSLLDSEVPPLRIEPVPIGELIQHAADDHLGLFRADEIELAVAIEPDLPTVDADGTRLLRLLQNLLDNARKHTPGGGSVSLSARALQGMVEIRVADTGPGIDSEDLKRLFDRYYRGRSPRTRTGDGTGLGLAICRAIADAHGGSLDVTSERGRGTAFIFRLPTGGSGYDTGQ